MEKLNISTGLKEYSLNGEVSVWFNPTDEAFISRVFNTFDELENKQAKYSEAIKSAKGVKGTLEVMQSMNVEMREMLSLLFDGVDIVTPLIGDTNVYAFAEGAPIWANIMFAIEDKLESEFAEQKKLSQKRMAKYTAKYESPDHKKKTTKKK